MEDKFQNKYRISSARLSSWDYGSNGAYFITTCTSKRRHYFGEIRNEQMQLSDIGKKAHECWLEIPNHFKFVALDEFTIMPNHLHGIIVIDKPDNYARVVDGGTFVETGHALSLLSDHRRQPSQEKPSYPPNQPHPRFPNQGKNTISAMVGSFKSAVTKWCNENEFPFCWQARFHDHIIRNNDEFHRIKNYIINNPANWHNDKFYSV